MKLSTFSIAASLLVLPLAAQAQYVPNGSNSPLNNSPITGTPWTVLGTGADVTATISNFDWNGGPSYDDVLYVSDSAGDLVEEIGHNHDQNTSIDLGTVAAGQEIIIAMVTQAGDTWYSGSASSLNSDGQIHANVYQSGANGVLDFEDLPNGSADWNYGDGTVTLSNVTAQAVPEPATYALLAIGAIGLLLRRRA